MKSTKQRSRKENREVEKIFFDEVKAYRLFFFSLSSCGSRLTTTLSIFNNLYLLPLKIYINCETDV